MIDKRLFDCSFCGGHFDLTPSETKSDSVQETEIVDDDGNIGTIRQCVKCRPILKHLVDGVPMDMDHGPGCLLCKRADSLVQLKHHHCSQSDYDSFEPHLCTFCITTYKRLLGLSV
jgi:hypothetical protein